MSEPAAGGEAGLVVTDLRVVLGGRRVVDGVSFRAPAAAVTVLLGPNGAGKSTILKTVAGLLPYDGHVHLGGREARSFDARSRPRAVAYVPQVSGLDAPLPVRDVVAQGRYAHRGGGLLLRTTADDEAAIAHAIAATEVGPLADRPFTELSHGERRRVLVARALASAAPVLLLDEPTAALDVGHALAMLAVLREVAQHGTAVVIVLHQLQEAVTVADHAVLLADGRAQLTGNATEVISAGPIRRVYGVDLVPAGQFACRLPRKAPEPSTS